MNNPSGSIQSAVQLDKIGQVLLTVDDLARSKTFYRDTLGMRFLFDAGTMAFFQCGEIRFGIGTADKPGPRGGTILYFSVAEIQEVCAALKEKGVVFLQLPHLVARMTNYDLWMAFFADPDGNTFGLMCEISRPS
ncbi:MAG: VOC family protein [Terracidiphilus sp.]|jgi:methylmalonyl-CoA/ethylmalonyl-CoA epimerase